MTLESQAGIVTLMNSSQTLRFAVTTSTGAEWTEKCKNTWGGWTNLHRRNAARLGLSGLDLRILETTHEGRGAPCESRDGTVTLRVVPLD